LSLVNSVSSRRAQKSGQDAPKLISRPSREAFRASRTSISKLVWSEMAGQAPSAYWPCVVPG
jgi:hypothetical protein